MKYLLLGLALFSFLQLGAQSPPRLGVVTHLDHDSLLATQGYTAITESTRRLLSPHSVSEAAFDSLLPRIKGAALPIIACNLFLPTELRVVGPEVDAKAVLTYTEQVFRRAQRAGIELIVWGSSGSRAVPEGYSRVTATAQFIRMARRVAEQAEQYDVTLAVENLNSGESNFMTTLSEALAVVRAVDHPHLRLCVDLYHMLREGEPASAITGVGPYAVYAELAEPADRTPPGVEGTDFVPYLQALSDEGYSGPLMIEAQWRALGEQGGAAARILRTQLHQAGAKQE